MENESSLWGKNEIKHPPHTVKGASPHPTDKDVDTNRPSVPQKSFTFPERRPASLTVSDPVELLLRLKD